MVDATLSIALSKVLSVDAPLERGVFLSPDRPTASQRIEGLIENHNFDINLQSFRYISDCEILFLPQNWEGQSPNCDEFHPQN